MTTRRLVAILLILALSGCERTFRDMYDQPRYKPLAGSPMWTDGRASRSPVDGTEPYSAGTIAGTSSGRLGRVEPGPAITPLDTVRDTLRPAEPRRVDTASEFTLPRITPELLARGRERFDIFCSPCHSIVGDGDGMIARRGFPHPPSFHTDRLREAGDAHFYAVISNGYGAMASYATRVEPSDRLAIVAYIRALQLSQHAPVAQLAEQDRTELDRGAAAATAPGGTR